MDTTGADEGDCEQMTSEERMSRPTIHTGVVEGAGGNPGMYLKEREDGPFSALVSFFRVVVSPHGPGHAVVFLTDPSAPVQKPDHVNAIYSDNRVLARYLVDEFARYFSVFRTVPGFGDLPIER